MAVDAQLLTGLHEQLAAQLVELTSGEAWLAWLGQARKFHRYSPQNQMLLALQGAQGHVASYRTWQRIPAQDGGKCQVAKGERGMVILAPMTVTHREHDDTTGDDVVVARGVRGFRTVHVFHQGQLVSLPALLDPPLPQLLQGPNRHQHVWTAVRARLEGLGYQVDLVARPDTETWNGRTDFLNTNVSVSDHLQPPARLKTLIHEWAHIASKHDQRLQARRDLQEVEAESVAYLVCASMGLDSSTYSVPYLASWAAGDPQLLRDTAERVLATAASLIDTLEHDLAIDVTPDLTPDQPTVADVTALSAVSDASPRVPEPSTETPLLDGAQGMVRTVMAGLADEADRQRLLDGLAHLDEHLPDVAWLCAAAGLDAAATLTLLTEHHANPDAAHQAINQPVADYLDERAPGPLFAHDEQHATRSAERAVSAALNRLSAEDRDLLDHLTLARPEHRATAARILADIGVTATEAAEIFGHYGLDTATVDATINALHYDPGSGQSTPLWPDPAPEPGSVPRPHPPSHDVATVAVARAVAAMGDGSRLAALAAALDLGPIAAASLWDAAGIDPAVSAIANVRRSGLDRYAPVAQPGSATAGPEPVAGTHNESMVSVARSILDSWNTAPAGIRPVPELA